MKTFLFAAALGLFLTGIVTPAADARRAERTPPVPATQTPRSEIPFTFASSGIDTFVLAEFDFEGPSGPDPQGWTSVDRTGQNGVYWHVDTFRVPTGGGNQAMWCGAQPDTTRELCGYGCLPGYGNDWRQVLETPAPFTVQGDVTLSFIANWDTESGYDYFYIDYLNQDSLWVQVDRVDGLVSDASPSYVIPATDLDGSVRLRFRFESDGLWSDEDCLYDTNGAVQLDDITVSDATGVLHVEDFEGEPVGATMTDDGVWVATAASGFGDYAGLLDASDLFLPTPDNDTYVWGFTRNSPRTCYHSYNCWVPCGPDTLHVVPGRGWYDPDPDLTNEIWSPEIDWTRDINGDPVDAGATVTLLQFRVYRNLTLEAAVLYNWFVRAFQAGASCAQWGNGNLSGYYGYQGDWYELTVDISAQIDPASERIQIALGAYDASSWLCYGIPECGDCLTVSPLFDDLRVIRCTPEPTGIGDTPVPRTALEPNYPNPFNPVTTIRYSIAERAHVSLVVYDVTGALVRTLVDEVLSPAEVAPVEWHGENDAGRAVSSGVYFYRLATKDFTQTRKMVLLK